MDELIERMEHERRYDLVLEGGGIKGIALIGALAVLEQRGYRPQRLAGTSAGAIVAALHAAGYTASELRALLLQTGFGSFRDRGPEDRIPLVGETLSVVFQGGIFEGRTLEAWVRDLLAARGVRTFAQLRGEDGLSRVQVIVSDVTERRLLRLPQDAALIGLEADELEVAFAVRASASLPLFYEPVRHKNPRTGRTHLLVDGGLLSNYPVWIFDVPGLPRWPTFGLKLVEDEPEASLGERLGTPQSDYPGILAYLRSLIETMLEAHDRLYIEKANFARTVAIPTLGVRTVEFDLPAATAEALYDSGRAAAERFLTSWNFARYVAQFRTLPRPSRREELRREGQTVDVRSCLSQ
nr:patatin-like phospholipase family protein [Deinobacterium chartae]